MQFHFFNFFKFKLNWKLASPGLAHFFAWKEKIYSQVGQPRAGPFSKYLGFWSQEKSFWLKNMFFFRDCKWYHENYMGGGVLSEILENSWFFMIFFFWPKKLVFYVSDLKNFSQYSYLHKRFKSHRQTHVNFGTNAS